MSYYARLYAAHFTISITVQRNHDTYSSSARDAVPLSSPRSSSRRGNGIHDTLPYRKKYRHSLAGSLKNKTLSLQLSALNSEYA